MNKIKVTSLEIVVKGTLEKPYYNIMYQQAEDGEIHLGYGSYDLKNLFEWRKKCFEIIEDDPQTQEDLELAQAVKMAFENEFSLSKDLTVDEMFGQKYVNTGHELPTYKDLLNWYREQKRGGE